MGEALTPLQVHVRVVAGARREAVEVLPKNRFKISVKQKAELGAANKRVVELLATFFKVPVSQVRILRGHKTPSKIISIG